MNESRHIIEALTTANPDHGFFGSIRRTYSVSEKDAPTLFDFAGQELVKRFKTDGRRFGPSQAKSWLDSVSGRHLVDSLGITKAKPSMQELQVAIVTTINTAPWITKRVGQA